MIKLNTVINQDCFLGMKEMDNESVDLILTDPPYDKLGRKPTTSVVGMNAFLKE